MANLRQANKEKQGRPKESNIGNIIYLLKKILLRTAHGDKKFLL